jgi:DNA ligase (NAD+)
LTENKKDIQLKIEQLRDRIFEADYKYYVLAEPDIEDYDYDIMLKELETLEKNYPEFDSDFSPTKRVSGKPVNKFNTVTHSVPMLSLSNSYNFDDLKDFDLRIKNILVDEKFEYVCELKFDGLAVSLRYENGKLIRGATRGDGVTGDDVTQNLKTIKSIPLSVKSNEFKNFEVRGEVFIRKDDFEKINREQEIRGEKLFANPRNTAAGTLKLKDSKEVTARPLNIFVYYLNTDNLKLTNHFENLKILEKLKFPVNKYYRKVSGIDDVKKYIDEIEEKRDTLPYEIDGVVVKVNSLIQQEIAGYTAKSPRWAIAYKYKAKQKSTIIRSITLQVGRVGTITPVAELEPVNLAGSTISRATLHNFDEIKRKDVREGDTVIIEKGGDVIPKVVEVILDKRKPGTKEFQPASKCPVCNSILEKPEDEVNYYCVNYFCPAQIQGRIEHFVGRDAMDIRGLGESIIQVLINKEFIKDYTDIFLLKEKKEELLKIERFGKKSIDNLLQSIEISKEKPFEKVLFAIGIRHIGEKTAKIIAKHFKSIESIISSEKKDFINVHEIGPKIASGIRNFFSEPESKILISKLKSSGLKFEIDKSSETLIKDSFKGKSFVLTGTLSKYTRTEAADLIEKYGGRTSSSVSKKTDFVLAGEDAGSKLEKAKSLGIKIISEDDFEAMVRA